MMFWWLPKFSKDSQISEGHQTVVGGGGGGTHKKFWGGAAGGGGGGGGGGSAKQVLVQSCLDHAYLGKITKERYYDIVLRSPLYLRLCITYLLVFFGIKY